MGNGRKQTALWLVFVEGAALSLGIYLLLTVLLSALVVKAVLPEEGSFPAVAASCCLASFAGAMLSVRRSSWGSLASAMVSAAGFLLAVVAVALLCWAAGACCGCAAQAGDFWRACWAGARGSGSAVRSAGAARPEKAACEFHQKYRSEPCRGDCGHSREVSRGRGDGGGKCGAPPLLCLQDIVVFRGGGGDLSRRFYKVNIILFT